MKQGLALVALMCACTSSSSTPDAGPPGGPVAGPDDGHCVADGGPIDQPVNLTSCDPQGPYDASAASGYGATQYGSSASDDQCKFNVSWTSTPIYQATDVTFTTTVTSRVDGSPTTKAALRIEAFLSDVHPAPFTFPQTTEAPAGTYQTSPIRFDKPGRWTVRFHLYDACPGSAPDSPHSHAAFYVDVP